MPGFSSRLVPPVETRPGKVKKWLASLPSERVTEHAREIYTALNAYNRMELEPAQRLELLELYREPVHRIVEQLQKQYVGLPLPLPAKHKGAAEQHRHFQLELAYGYKYLVLAWLGRAKAGDQAALALHRAVRHLRDVLLACYLSYSPQPLNLWREVHSLYVEAKRLGIAGRAVADPLARARDSTIADAYKHALLLDLADPYHLPSRMALRIDSYLEGFAHLASLHRGFERVEPNCHFLIDFAADQAGVLYSKDTVLGRTERFGLLNTVELARQVHQQLTELRRGRRPAAEALPADFFDEGSEEMLLRLINVWGLNPKRTFRRTRTPNEQVCVAIGLEEINYWLNGGRRLVISAERMGPFPHTVDINVFALGRDSGAGARAAPPAGSWKVQDESAGGMALRRSGIIRRRVKVGDLIATSVAPDEGWSIGVVRWVKSPNASEVEIGTQRLAPSAIPVVVKVMSERGKESDYMPSLLLPAVPAQNEPPTLVAPRHVFRPERTLHVDDGHKLVRLSAKRLLEVTSEFERMEFNADTT